MSQVAINETNETSEQLYDENGDYYELDEHGKKIWSLDCVLEHWWTWNTELNHPMSMYKAKWKNKYGKLSTTDLSEFHEGQPRFRKEDIREVIKRSEYYKTKYDLLREVRKTNQKAVERYTKAKTKELKKKLNDSRRRRRLRRCNL